MTRAERLVLGVAGGFAWGVALPGPLGTLLVLAGAVAWAVGVRGQAAPSVLFALTWFATATVGWWGETWGRFGAPWPWALWALFVVIHAIPAAAASALAGSSVGSAFAAGLAMEALFRWTSPAPIGPALLLVGTPVLEAPAALGGRSLEAAVVLGFGALAATSPRRAAVAAGGWVLAGAAWMATAQPGTVRVSAVEPAIGPFGGRVASQADARAERVRALVASSERPFLPEGAWTGADPPAVTGTDRDGWNAIVTPEGAMFGKRYLVPVAERRWLGLGKDRYRAGDLPRSLAAYGLTVAPLVCYEDLLPAAIAEIPRDADLLLCASNDGWLGPGRASELHLAATRLAAVETGRWAVRPTSCGRTAIVDPLGRVIAATPWTDADRSPSAGTVVTAKVAPRRPLWTGAALDRWLGALGIAALLAEAALRRRSTPSRG